MLSLVRDTPVLRVNPSMTGEHYSLLLLPDDPMGRVGLVGIDRITASLLSPVVVGAASLGVLFLLFLSRTRVMAALMVIALFLENSSLSIPFVIGEGTLVSIPVASILKRILLLRIVLFIPMD